MVNLYNLFFVLMPKILLLGLGCIGGCVYQILPDYFDNIELTILDKIDNLEEEVLKYKSTSKLNMNFKVNIIKSKIKKKNYVELLTPLFKKCRCSDKFNN